MDKYNATWPAFNPKGCRIVAKLGGAGILFLSHAIFPIASAGS
jgi:hypothetical protein